jgi:hypothetical protein
MNYIFLLKAYFLKTKISYVFFFLIIFVKKKQVLVVPDALPRV